MELTDLLGDSYKEGMTTEEITTALKEKTFVDPSTLPKSVEKTVFDKTASELAQAKRTLRELQEKSMTEDEKRKSEMTAATEMQARFGKEIAKLRAKEVFVGAGLKEEDYAEMLDVVVSDDEEVTKTRASSMVKLISAQKKLAEDAIKTELLKGTPKPPAGSDPQGGGLAKAIEEAKASGDMARVSSLIRQQAQANNSK